MNLHSLSARTRRRWGLSLLTAAVCAIGLAAPAAPASAAPPQGRLKITPLTGGTLVQGAKSVSGRLAKTDADLLKQQSSKPVHVMVKLDYDALASYRGDIPGLAATSPAVTKRKFDPRSAEVREYDQYAAGIENKFRSALAGRISGAQAGKGARLVYGGVPVTLPGDKVDDLLKLPGVVAVQKDDLEKLLTDSSPDFIGAPTIYNQLGGSNSSGKGVIVGVLDSGAWPEHPQYTDPGNLPAPPPTTDGSARPCNFGDNPQTPANDPFQCNRKLISGQPFLDTYNAVVGGEMFANSARDSDGHGTHTSTTSAGGPAAHADPLGIDRGAIHGIAPAAHIAVYKVCGAQGCFDSDVLQAVSRAIVDKVRVINFSISGGVDPYSDAVELAFLDAYAAGILVSASAGNEGPGAATVNHNGAWVTTVAASTQKRAFRSTVTLRSGSASLTIKGSSITRGISAQTPVVLASAPPYSDQTCDHEAEPGTFTGKIVVCLLPQRGRVLKGYNVFKGGAAGMLLYNGTLSQTMTDNHWLPTVHLEQPEGAQLVDFLSAHPGTTASFTQGTKTTWAGDVMTAFSSRGPGADFLKPDVTAPGLQIMAGHTPVTDTVEVGPPGNRYQVIAGTSMSAPHVAGAAALLFALHPDWTPGQVHSALETTAKTSVIKHDRKTPADPFDFGGGRIDLTKAGDPGLTIDETAANYAASAATPLERIDLNVPSVNAPTMPGVITTSRTVKNVSGKTLTYKVSATSSAGTKIAVRPAGFTLSPGKTAKLNISITALDAPIGQYFGQIKLDQTGGSRDLHLPVAFFRKQGEVTLEQACDPASIAVNSGRSTCTTTVQNTTLASTDVSVSTSTSNNLQVTSVNGATLAGPHTVMASAHLKGREPDKPNIAPVAGSSYVSLPDAGIPARPIGDEQILNFATDPYVFAGKTYTQLGITSNGYTVAGGGTTADVNFQPQTLPDPDRPNGVMAPFWTDLDGTNAPGIYLAVASDDAGNAWIVVEWRENLWGTTSLRVFQQWIGLNGTEDITFAYDPANLPAAPPAEYGLTVGAENDEGTAGSQIEGPPTTDLGVTSTPGAPGGSLTYSFVLKGLSKGTGTVTTILSTPLVRGLTTDVDKVTVK